jgi:hypothetical protein
VRVGPSQVIRECAVSVNSRQVWRMVDIVLLFLFLLLLWWWFW